MLACVSHAPIILIRAKAPEEEPQILEFYDRCTRAIRSFDPDVVVMFGSDHFAGFFLSAMPAFCVGFAARAVDDVGGFGGPLAVPADAAKLLVGELRAAGFDPAISYKMTLDHAFSQPLKRLTGALDRYPTIPIFIGALVPPFISIERSRAFGACVGHQMRTRGGRVLFLGSGGLSHHPTRYYPLIGEGRPDVADWQMSGPRGHGFTEEQWFAKLHSDHVDGAAMLVSGARTKEDIRLNPEFDRWFMDRFADGDVEALSRLSPEDMLARAGLGSLELHTWVAALAAHSAAGGSPPSQSIYAATLEYGGGYGMAFSVPS
jgi:2,3-dihydroxyphenylpropionate 1,2-dioxygenase